MKRSGGVWKNRLGRRPIKRSNKPRFRTVAKHRDAQGRLTGRTVMNRKTGEQIYIHQGE